MENSEVTLYYSGLSGLQLPIPKYKFPEPYENASRLVYYASFFNSIEINSSFYKIPRAETVFKWASAVPENFKFTFKLWREITHRKGLVFDEEDVTCFFNSINSVQDKKGCLLIQLPPSLDSTSSAQLEKLLRCIKDEDVLQSWKIAVEFRNKSWYNEQIYSLLNMYNATLVVHDIPKSAAPFHFSFSNFRYIRFHGPTGNYRGSYPESFLSEYAEYIKEWVRENKLVYVYFNNTMGDAFTNLQTLKKLIDKH